MSSEEQEKETLPLVPTRYPRKKRSRVSVGLFAESELSCTSVAVGSEVEEARPKVPLQRIEDPTALSCADCGKRVKLEKTGFSKKPNWDWKCVRCVDMEHLHSEEEPYGKV
jgi:hypothetical protein